jgi:hypothetical protein
MTTYTCEICDIKCCKPIDWQRHLKTKKHIGRSNPTQKSFECKFCSFICYKQSAYAAHIKTNKHANRLQTGTTPLPEQGISITKESSSQHIDEICPADFTPQADFTPVNKSSKVLKKFNCRKCDFTCEKLSNWNLHIETNKHKIRVTPKSFECKQCNYTAITKSLLNKHLKTKKHENNNKIEPSNSDSEIMVITKQLLAENTELKNFIMKQSEEHKKEVSNILTQVLNQANFNRIDTNHIINVL